MSESETGVQPLKHRVDRWLGGNRWTWTPMSGEAMVISGIKGIEQFEDGRGRLRFGFDSIAIESIAALARTRRGHLSATAACIYDGAEKITVEIGFFEVDGPIRYWTRYRDELVHGKVCLREVPERKGWFAAIRDWWSS